MKPTEVTFSIGIEPNRGREVKDPVIAIGDFIAVHPMSVIYPDSGQGLSLLYLDLIAGRALPLKIVFKQIKSLLHLTMAALYTNRAIALSENFPGFMIAVELSSLSEAGLAHINPDLARFLIFLDQYLLAKGSAKDFGERLGKAINWVAQYVKQGKIPVSLPSPEDPPKILDIGSNGFVIAETSGNSSQAIIDLYRVGHFRGVIYGSGSVTIFKKSHYLSMDLTVAKTRLDQAEEVIGGTPWVLDNLRLFTPNTALSRELITNILVRV